MFDRYALEGHVSYDDTAGGSEKSDQNHRDDVFVEMLHHVLTLSVESSGFRHLPIKILRIYYIPIKYFVKLYYGHRCFAVKYVYNWVGVGERSCILGLSGIKWEDRKEVMLIGEFTHTLDSKKRLSLPAKFRKEVGRKVVITRGLDQCLFMYPLAAWREITEKLSKLPVGQSDTRGITRFILAGASEVEVDSAGRVLLPDFLTTFANLTGKVALTGVGDRIEVWDEKVWSDYKRRIEKEAEGMAQTLGDLGIL